MQEMIDWLNEAGKKIGVVGRNIAHKDGLWHKSVHVWVVNDKGQVLLQHRCKEKRFFPSKWDCAFAGHVDAGENSLSTAIREGKEELGLKFHEEEFEFLCNIKDSLVWQELISNEFVDVYLVRKNIGISQICMQKEEVDEIKWVNIDKFFHLIESCDDNFILHAREEYDKLKEKLKINEIYV